MVTKDVVKELAAVEGLTQAAAGRVYERLLEVVRVSLLTEQRFSLPGIGVLKVVGRAARTAHNPQTGAPVKVPAKKTLKVKIADELKRTLNP